MAHYANLGAQIIPLFPPPSPAGRVLDAGTLESISKLTAEMGDAQHLFDGEDACALAYVAKVAAGHTTLPEARQYWARPSPFLRASPPPLDVGVDPVAGGNVRATSDEFFATCGRTFDLIFVDGLHESAQVVRDAANALRILNPGGTLLFHDCKPLLPPEGAFPMAPGTVYWNGTVWQAIAHLRTAPDIDVVTADFDWGVGIVRRAPNSSPIALRVPFGQLTWSDCEANWRAYLRPSTMVEVDAFLTATAPRRR
ncbi:methyltransferase domain-containing protein [Aureococcus anophagefferens]|nr:methyltransferase domain-containing protein [Aureococcus anophagefferens]